MTVTETGDTTFVDEWTAWHALRDATFAEPLGWLSLTALHWLVDTDSTFSDLPGAWRADADAVVVTARPADDLSIDGVAVDGSVTLTPVEGAPGLIVNQGPRRVEVIRRTGEVALRIHDPLAPALAQFSRYPDLRSESAVAHRRCLHRFQRGSNSDDGRRRREARTSPRCARNNQFRVRR